MTGRARLAESTAAYGARWITFAFVIVGLLNYGYTLILTRLLNVASYSRFAAGQGLVLWASTVATVCIPWILAQALARAQSDSERISAVRFAKLISAGSGIVMGAAVGAIALRFADSAAALALALSTFVIILGTTTTGWLQGRERMRTLSVLYVMENLLKNGAGVLLVVVAKRADTGALAAFGIGGIVMLLRWPRTVRSGSRKLAIANRQLWRRAAGIAGVQAIVSLFVALDVVLVAFLPGDRMLAASYQASAALSRIPLFIAGAVATAFFPSLSRGADAKMLAARATRMYTAVSIPLAAVLMTIPAALLAVAFPAQYGAVATLLKFTAVTGLGAGGISLITAFFQAADDYSCIKWLIFSLVGYVLALLVGWDVGGIVGLAVGGAVGASTALLLLGYRLVRRQSSRILARVPVAEPIAAVAVLFVLRPYVVFWLAAATLVGLRAGLRFLRPGARHARTTRWLTITAANGRGRRRRPSRSKTYGWPPTGAEVQFPEVSSEPAGRSLS